MIRRMKTTTAVKAVTATPIPAIVPAFKAVVVSLASSSDPQFSAWKRCYSHKCYYLSYLLSHGVTLLMVRTTKDKKVNKMHTPELYCLDIKRSSPNHFRSLGSEVLEISLFSGPALLDDGVLAALPFPNL